MDEETTLPLRVVTHPILGRGTTNHMAGKSEAKKCSVQEPTISGTTYRKLLHRSASLDLEIASKRIKLSQNLKPVLCQDCQKEKCQCPAFMPETLCSSASSMPTKPDSDQEDIPKLVPEVPLETLYPPVLSPSDKEADWEVAAICSAPIYYQVRSRHTKRHRYYTYDVLDYVMEQHISKRQCYSPSQLQGYPAEH